MQNTVLGKTDAITFDSVAKINDVDYEDCDIDFDNNTAKVTIKGSGKFEGLYVCNGTKTSATATEEECIPVINETNFADDNWATIVAAVKQAEINGTEYPYNVGNEKIIDLGTTLGTHTIRVANKTKCNALQTEPVSKTACGFVLEFADIIKLYNVNPVGEYYGTQYDYGTNVGGWPASEMRKHLNDLDSTADDDGIIYNALPETLRNGIINTYVVSSYGSDKTTGVVENENVGVLESDLYWSNDKLYLLSPQEVYGTSFTDQYDSSNGTSRQLDYYATYEGTNYIGVITTNSEGAIKQYEGINSWWWLRSAYSSNNYNFSYVASSGGWGYNRSYDSGCLSPTFRLAN